MPLIVIHNLSFKTTSMKVNWKLSIGETLDTLKEVGEVSDVVIIDDFSWMTKFHCTVIRLKWNKVISWREFVIEWQITKEQVETRLIAHYITIDVIGKLQPEISDYFQKVASGEVEHDVNWKLDFLFGIFKAHFRLLIT